jgi:hypothetical protein
MDGPVLTHAGGAPTTASNPTATSAIPTGSGIEVARIHLRSLHRGRFDDDWLQLTHSIGYTSLRRHRALPYGELFSPAATLHPEVPVHTAESRRGVRSETLAYGLQISGADGRALPPRSNGVTMTSDTTVLTSDTGMQTAPAVDTGADSTALDGGFTMGSGN